MDAVLTPHERQQVSAYAVGRLQGRAARHAHHLVETSDDARAILRTVRAALVDAVERGGSAAVPDSAEDRLMARLRGLTDDHPVTTSSRPGTARPSADG
ncbi:hypothetical protein [uncultured Deinococcus sp.]|uniref:Uncharacterized protein n=1 Tax=Deinococcus rufus TaxID=2136097 RepID=A0ABV7ZBS2_9DEIO|nr:hypothetical protein [uncultured Deinococcus sp.]